MRVGSSGDISFCALLKARVGRSVFLLTNDLHGCPQTGKVEILVGTGFLNAWVHPAAYTLDLTSDALLPQQQVRGVIDQLRNSFEFNEQARFVHEQSHQCSRNCS